MGASLSQEDTSQLKFLYEGHEEFSALPSFAVIPPQVYMRVEREEERERERDRERERERERREIYMERNRDAIVIIIIQSRV